MNRIQNKAVRTTNWAIHQSLPTSYDSVWNDSCPGWAREEFGGLDTITQQEVISVNFLTLPSWR